MRSAPDVDVLLQELARAYRDSAQAAGSQAAAARDRAEILRRIAGLSAELARHSCEVLAVASRCAGEAATREAKALELMARVNDAQAARARAQSRAALARRQLQEPVEEIASEGAKMDRPRRRRSRPRA